MQSILGLFVLIICSYSLNAQKTILAIFAHPDDETTISPVLAEYASLGYDVNIIIATDGRYGVTDHADIPSGDSLISIRKKEIQCSCKALGINPPILLNAHDGMKGMEGVGAQFNQFHYLTTAIDSITKQINPDIIITMGPEGDSGHPDHKIISAIVSQLHFSAKKLKKVDLYYCSWSKRQAEKYGDWNLHHVASDYINTKIEYNEVSEKKHFDAIRCYKSQYSEDEMQHWINLDKEDKVKEIYFRRVIDGGEIRTSF